MGSGPASKLDLVFEVKTQPADKITVLVDMQSVQGHTLTGKGSGGQGHMLIWVVGGHMLTVRVRVWGAVGTP